MKNIKSFDECTNEGFFDFLKDDVVDYTKPDKDKDKPKEKQGIKRWIEYLKDKEYRDFTVPDKKSKFQDRLNTIAKKYGIEEEEEEEEEENTGYATKQQVHKAYQERDARRRDIGRRYKERKDQKYKSNTEK